MKFSNVCTAKQATVLRSNVYAEVDTICVYKDMFTKDHKQFRAAFTYLGFLFLPNSWVVFCFVIISF